MDAPELTQSTGALHRLGPEDPTWLVKKNLTASTGLWPCELSPTRGWKHPTKKFSDLGL